MLDKWENIILMHFHPLKSRKIINKYANMHLSLSLKTFFTDFRGESLIYQNCENVKHDTTKLNASV